MEIRDYSNEMNNLRKAFRLIYNYQKCMKSLVTYIKTKYGFEDEILGHKRFSNTIDAGRKNGCYDANLKIGEASAWDFVYPYEFEYFFGCQDIKEKKENKTRKYQICMSVIQVSDTGHYFQNDTSETNADKFKDTDKSDSILIFACEKMRKSSKWETTEYLDEIIKKIICGKASKWIPYEKDENTGLLVKRYHIEDFDTQSSADKLIKDFSNLFYKKTGIKIIKV